MVRKQFRIMKETGFARPAIFLMSSSVKCQSRIRLDFDGESIDIKNVRKPLIKIMQLHMKPGDCFCIDVEGIDELQVLQEIECTLYEFGLEA